MYVGLEALLVEIESGGAFLIEHKAQLAQLLNQDWCPTIEYTCSIPNNHVSEQVKGYRN